MVLLCCCQVFHCVLSSAPNGWNCCPHTIFSHRSVIPDTQWWGLTKCTHMHLWGLTCVSLAQSSLGQFWGGLSGLNFYYLFLLLLAERKRDLGQNHHDLFEELVTRLSLTMQQTLFFAHTQFLAALQGTVFLLLMERCLLRTMLLLWEHRVIGHAVGMSPSGAHVMKALHARGREFQNAICQLGRLYMTGQASS